MMSEGFAIEKRAVNYVKSLEKEAFKKEKIAQR